MECVVYHHGSVLDYFIAIARLPSEPRNPGADRSRLPPDHLARSAEDIVGIVSSLRSAIASCSRYLLAQSGGRGVLRPSHRSARSGPPLPLCGSGVPAAHVHRTAAGGCPGPGAPDRPVARRAPEHRAGTRGQSRRPPRRGHGRADQPHDAAAPRALRPHHAPSSGKGARGG